MELMKSGKAWKAEVSVEAELPSYPPDVQLQHLLSFIMVHGDWKTNSLLLVGRSAPDQSFPDHHFGLTD